jgi:hypothetical protein
LRSQSAAVLHTQVPPSESQVAWSAQIGVPHRPQSVIADDPVT